MSKKYLVPYSLEKGASKGKQCVVPINDGHGLKFISLSSGFESDFGMVVYGGKELSSTELFAKVVDAGYKILPSVDDYTNLLESFLEKVSGLKIGDIAKLSISEEQNLILEKQKIEKEGKSKLP